ncbi:hypothetical protein BH20ACI3_BH20ACI3_36040 [soil metagenome]
MQELSSDTTLSHYRIVSKIGSGGMGEADGTNYIATEFIEGKTSREHLSAKEPMSLNDILKIGVQVAEALSAAHQQGDAETPESASIEI